MEIVASIGRMREVARELRERGERTAFVPTMGCLHEGHLALVRRGRELAPRVIMSSFVNPTQFAPGEDFARYPRTPEQDRESARSEQVDFLFEPTVGEMYPGGFRTHVEVEGLQDRLCGRTRPGHFRGVATVVAKLLNVVQPAFVLFGEKDRQQLLILERMVADLGFDVVVIGCETVREEDGLAMSSRNTYLTGEERASATVLRRALAGAALAFAAGERRGASLAACMRSALDAEPRARVDYAEVVDTETLEPVERIATRALCALAVYIGRTRLIDNLVLGAERPQET